MTIRDAVVEDAPVLLRMSLRFLESDFKTIVTPNADALSALILAVLAQGAVFIAEREHANECSSWCHLPDPERCTMHGPHVCNCGPRAVGMLALVVLPHPMTGRPFADEVAWWVEPEYRKGLAGPQLLRRAERYAQDAGLSLIKMVAPAASSVGAFYERRGYVAVETAYQKVFDVPAPEEVHGDFRGRHSGSGSGKSSGEEEGRPVGVV
jgi:hypothetical protein